MDPDEKDQPDKCRISLFMSKLFDMRIGTKDQVDIRRNLSLMGEYVRKDRLDNMIQITVGSRADGFRMKTSDRDHTYILKNTVAVYIDEYNSGCMNDTECIVVLIKKSHCRPGYVFLELESESLSLCSGVARNAIVRKGDTMYLSSDKFRQGFMEKVSRGLGLNAVPNGPSFSFLNLSVVSDYDMVSAIPCYSWPKEAGEWVVRKRMFGWPSKTLINKIIADGCSVVPVGDKFSEDSSLQWRISFVSAERLLVYSLNHTQFKVYGQLKLFLNDFKGYLRLLCRDDDNLCSYFMKNLIFHAVENSPRSLWQEENMFACFSFCINILIDWANAEYCPNYFILGNNLFIRKINSRNKQDIIDCLYNVRHSKWNIQSFREMYCPHLWKHLQLSIELEYPKSLNILNYLEYERDRQIFYEMIEFVFQTSRGSVAVFKRSLTLLLFAKSDIQEIFAYQNFVRSLASLATLVFEKLHDVCENNKQKYLVLRQCKRWLIMQTTIGANQGLLELATFYHQVGNYAKALEICNHLLSSFNIYISSGVDDKVLALAYMEQFCGKENGLLEKSKVWLRDIEFNTYILNFCPQPLLPNVLCHPLTLYIPPLPYAAFLAFLCHDALGNITERHDALIELELMQYDEEHRGSRPGIVHGLLGLCYEVEEDIGSSIVEYWKSLCLDPEYNVSWRRIKILLRNCTNKTNSANLYYDLYKQIYVK